MKLLEDSYFETQSERNSISRSVAAERTMNGMKTDSVPTRKEFNSKCGEVVTFNYGKPMKWKEFKTWDARHRKEYIETLVKKYCASIGMLSEMFGVSKSAVQHEIDMLKVKTNCKPGRSKEKDAEWKNFINSLSEAKNLSVQDTSESVAVQNKTKKVIDVEEKKNDLFTMIVNSGEISAEGKLSEIIPNLIVFISDKLPKEAKIKLSWDRIG